MVLPCSDRITRVPPYSRIFILSTRTGLSPCIAVFSKTFRFLNEDHWPDPLSLATTNGVSVDVLSSGYMRCFSSPGLLPWPMDSAKDSPYGLGCPIRKSADRRVLSPSSRLIAACYVLHRLRTPRHPPDALALTLDRSALVSHAQRKTQGNRTRSFGSRY